MKKILSFLAASALALGLIGCSGDLHDAPLLDTTILKEAAIIGTITSWQPQKMTKVNDTTYTYNFTASKSTEEFSIQEVFDKWATRWCGNNTKGAQDAEDTTKCVPGGDLQSMVYSSEADPTHVQLKDLTNNSEYKITVVIVDSSKKAISCKIELTKAAEPTIPNISGWGLKGSYVSDAWDCPDTGWVSFTATATPNQYKVEFTPAGSSVAFGFVKGSDKDAAWVTGGGFTITELNSTFTGSVSSGDNSSISGLTADTTYVLTITIKDVDGNADAVLTTK